MALILGIESSCDETAAALLEDRTKLRSSVIASQIEIHREYGGVVPELAARRHVEAIGYVISRALEEAGTGWDDLDAIAVTHGPGLIGCLLVGVSTAKAIAWQRELPLLAINHLEGHVRSVFIEHPQIEYPAVALVVSGGHTSLYLCPCEGEYRSLARTRDDAVTNRANNGSVAPINVTGAKRNTSARTPRNAMPPARVDAVVRSTSTTAAS